MLKKRFARSLSISLSFVFLLVTTSCGQTDETTVPDHIAQPIGPPPKTQAFSGTIQPKTIYKIDPNPEAGFYWPYFLHIPATMKAGAPLLVQPNNDGQAGAPYETHLYWAAILNEQGRLDFGDALGTAFLTPVFPRPSIEGPDDNLYVHALTRAAMLEPSDSLRRPDLQLLAMIEDARQKLQEYTVPEDVLLWGFSAAGDFVTRMAFLHPDKVRAVAAGGVGGFPILPTKKYKGHRTTYPVGIGDFKKISGATFNAKELQHTPMLLLHGSIDENDSVAEGKDLNRKPFGSDSYSYEQALWINETFGTSTTARIDQVITLFQDFGMQDFTFAIYPGIEHKVTKEMEAQIVRFFQCVLEGKTKCSSGQ